MVTNINILKENIEEYKFMFIIENSLRELIIDIMQKNLDQNGIKVESLEILMQSILMLSIVKKKSNGKI